MISLETFTQFIFASGNLIRFRYPFSDFIQTKISEFNDSYQFSFVRMLSMLINIPKPLLSNA